MMLGPKKDMEEIANAVRKVQAHAARIVSVAQSGE
jgi:hypothetical protein